MVLDYAQNRINTHRPELFQVPLHQRLVAEPERSVDSRSQFRLGGLHRTGSLIQRHSWLPSRLPLPAYKLARILWAMLEHRRPYDPKRLGNSELARARKERYLRRQAEQLGFALTPVEGEVS